MSETRQNAEKLVIHHIDVGQGDSTLILKKDGDGEIETAILIDGGGKTPRGNTKSHVQIGELVLNFCKKKLKKNGLRASNKLLDYIIISHYHGDHIGSLPTVIDSEIVEKGTTVFVGPTQEDYINRLFSNTLTGVFKNLVISICGSIRKEDFLKEIKSIEKVKEDNPIKLNFIENLTPTSDETSHNFNSLAFLFSIGDVFKYYTGGDLEAKEKNDGDEKVGEKKIFDEKFDHRLSAFKVSHHGSTTATPAELVSKFSETSVGVISYGKNSYGNTDTGEVSHPHCDVVERLINSKLKRLYFTGQIDAYEKDLTLIREKSSTGFDSKINLDSFTRAPGVVSIKAYVDGSFYVNYDSFTLDYSKEKVKDAERNKLLPENSLFEILKSFPVKISPRDDLRMAAQKASKSFVNLVVENKTDCRSKQEIMDVLYNNWEEVRNKANGLNLPSIMCLQSACTLNKEGGCGKACLYKTCVLHLHKITSAQSIQGKNRAIFLMNDTKFPSNKERAIVKMTDRFMNSAHTD